MPRLFVLFSLPAVVLLALGTAFAQKFQLKSVSFSGTSAPQSEMLAATGLAQGAAITQAEMQAGAQRLSETGIFSDVRYTFDGQVLHYVVKPATNILPAEFENFPWWDEKVLEGKLESRIPLFHGSLSAESGMQTSLIDALTAMLREQQVTASISAMPRFDKLSGKVIGIAFHVDQPAIQVGTVSFSGASPAWTTKLSGVAAEAAGRDFGASSTPDALSEAVQHVYHNQGYLDARAIGIERQTPVVDGARIVVPMVVSVTEGQQYHFGHFTLTGSVPTSEDEFQKAAKLKTGDVVEEDKLRATMKLLTNTYLTRGYLHAKIKATPALDRDTRVADYAISVVPGDIYTMGSIELLELSDDQRAQVLKIWKMKSGDPFDQTYASKFLVSNKEQLHSLNGYAATFKQIEHLDTHAIDLVITFAKLVQ